MPSSSPSLCASSAHILCVARPAYSALPGTAPRTCSATCSATCNHLARDRRGRRQAPTLLLPLAAATFQMVPPPNSPPAPPPVLAPTIPPARRARGCPLAVCLCASRSLSGPAQSLRSGAFPTDRRRGLRRVSRGRARLAPCRALDGCRRRAVTGRHGSPPQGTRMLPSTLTGGMFNPTPALARWAQAQSRGGGAEGGPVRSGAG